MKKLALAHDESETERIETTQVYAVPPWHDRVPMKCEADRECAAAAANDVGDIVVTTNSSERGGLVGMGGIICHRSTGRADDIVVARYSVTIGSRDG
jgi:hypothetical protein